MGIGAQVGPSNACEAEVGGGLDRRIADPGHGANFGDGAGPAGGAVAGGLGTDVGGTAHRGLPTGQHVHVHDAEAPLGGVHVAGATRRQLDANAGMGIGIGVVADTVGAGAGGGADRGLHIGQHREVGTALEGDVGIGENRSLAKHATKTGAVGQGNGIVGNA